MQKQLLVGNGRKIKLYKQRILSERV